MDNASFITRRYAFLIKITDNDKGGVTISDISANKLDIGKIKYFCGERFIVPGVRELGEFIESNNITFEDNYLKVEGVKKNGQR